MLTIGTKELNISEELRKKVDMRTNHKEYGIPYNFNLFEVDYGYPLKMNWELRTEKQAEKYFKKLSKTLGSEKDKDNVVEEMTSYHGLGYYNGRDLHDIADDTPREEEINSYIYEQNYGIDKDYDDRDIDI